MENSPGFLQYSASWFRQAKALHVASLLLAAFFVLAIFVRIYGTFEVDIYVTRALQSLRSPALDTVIGSVTRLGDTAALAIVSLVAAGLMYKKGLASAAVYLCASSLLVIPLNMGIKSIVERLRPEDVVVEVLVPVGGYSFPSGHVMGSTVVYGTLMFLAWSYMKPGRKRAATLSVLAILIFLVSLSRIYLGVHWFSDVLGGWLSGVALLLLMAEGYHLALRRQGV